MKRVTVLTISSLTCLFSLFYERDGAWKSNVYFPFKIRLLTQVFCQKISKFKFLMEQYWTNNRRCHNSYILKFDTAKLWSRMKEFTYRLPKIFLFLKTVARFSLGRCDDINLINLYNWNCFPLLYNLKKNLLGYVASEHSTAATIGYNLISSSVPLQTSKNFRLPKLCTFYR